MRHLTGKSLHTKCERIFTQTPPTGCRTNRIKPHANSYRGYLPMENAIARKLDPPEINPVEIESVLLNRL
ncbi:hypothetical protein ACU40_22220, partial [Salmonella enterica]|nr:hypothetical protein [Salmonella enterica]